MKNVAKAIGLVVLAIIFGLGAYLFFGLAIVAWPLLVLALIFGLPFIIIGIIFGNSKK